MKALASFNLQNCLETCRRSEVLVRVGIDAAEGLSVFQTIGQGVVLLADL